MSKPSKMKTRKLKLINLLPSLTVQFQEWLKQNKMPEGETLLIRAGTSTTGPSGNEATQTRDLKLASLQQAKVQSSID